ncbi:DUF11 domain-containing protein, partial [Hymenobacter aerophilus]|uniref:DUF11 domain-containing protein n=1 Tax=Hymenobacter aerophilus TaxID=119644 RepID=UPI001969A63E
MPVPQTSRLAFSAAENAVSNNTSFTFKGRNADGASTTTAKYTFKVGNGAPITRDFTNPTLIGNNSRQNLRDLAAWGFSGLGGTINTLRFTALPNAAFGTLYVNGGIAAVNTDYPASRSAQLSFQPVTNYSGTGAIASFSVKNSEGVTSNISQLGIPVNKATCAQALVFDFTARPDGEDWAVQRTVAVANSNVTITARDYSAPAGQTTLTTDYRAGSPGYALDWFTDYTGSLNSTGAASVTSTINFDFNRPLKNFSFTMGDLDKGLASIGSAFVDDVTFNGYKVDGTVVQLLATDISLAPNGNNFFTAGSNRITGQGNTGTEGPDGNVTVNFREPIVRLELIYKNLQTEVDNSGTQAVYISAFTWCEEADLLTTLTGPARGQAGQTVSYTVTTRNQGDTNASGVVTQVLLTKNLQNVTGGTYVASTGVLTLPTIGTMTSNQQSVTTISFTMPATGIVTGKASSTSSSPDTEPANNNGSLANANVTTVQNRPPAANNVTAPAIAANASPTTIPALTGTDPDGNNTIDSYRITTLPPAAQGTLSLNGTLVTTTTVIKPAQASQLQFKPSGSFDGNVTFSYTVIDDLGAQDATPATYTIPVSPVADLGITLTAGASPINAGATGTFTVAIKNNGPSAAQTVNAQVQLPAGLTNVTATNGGTYDPTTGIVSYTTIASVPASANEFASSTISFTAPATGPVNAIATLTTATSQGANTAPDQATATIAVTPVADV